MKTKNKLFRILAAIVETELASTEVAKAVVTHREVEAEVYFQARLLDSVQQSVIATDTLGRIIYWNSFAEKLYGWNKTEVIGKKIQDVLPMVNQENEETLENPNENILKQIANSTTSKVNEHLIRHRSGKVVYQSPSVERVMGYAVKDWATGKNSFEEVHPDDQTMLSNHFEEFKKHSGQTASSQFRFRHNKDRSWHYMEATIQNLLDVPGVNAIVVNAGDITMKFSVKALAFRHRDETLF